MKEVARVVKPDGLVITIAPVSWPYHAAPIDCWRVYPAGLNALWGDGHANYSTTKAAFDAKWWGGTGANPSSETPGDNPTKWRTIVSYLRP